MQQKIPPWDFGWATLYHTEIIIPGPFPYCAYSGMAIRNFRVASKKEKSVGSRNHILVFIVYNSDVMKRHFAYCNADRCQETWEGLQAGQTKNDCHFK